MRIVRSTAAKALIVLAAALATVSFVASSGTATAAVTRAASNIAPPSSSSSAYSWVSYFRQLAGESTVSRNATLESGIATHVRYMANHALACETDPHNEQLTATASCPRNPYATTAGKAAANNSDITRISVNSTPRAAVTDWFTSAFHALVLLDPKLRSTGYASYYTSSPQGAGPLAWPFTAGVDVYRGRTGTYGGNTIAFPATGAVSPLTTYKVGTESPEPFRTTSTSSPCHSWGSLKTTSSPVIVQWPLAARVNMSGVLRDVTTGHNLNTCSLTPASYPSGSLGKLFLSGPNGYTKGAFYYASTPFVPGHRYTLTVGGSLVSSFAIANLPGAAGTSNVSKIAAATVNWTAATTAGTGSIVRYTAQLFTGACTGAPIRSTAVSSATRTATFTSLAHNTRYYTRTVTVNSAGAGRSSVCRAVVTR